MKKTPLSATGISAIDGMTNTNILGGTYFPTPNELKNQLPISKKAAKTILSGRAQLQDILMGKSEKLLVITGPCSIHSEADAIDYADRLAILQRYVSDHVLLVMRVYFEKPRTVGGWKGLIADPQMDGSNNIPLGLQMARRILARIAEKGVLTGTEFLDTTLPQYFDDLVTWGCIGARNVESQTHRSMASGLSVPVGFKNTPTGSIQAAVNAVKNAMGQHSFPGIDGNARLQQLFTTGNSFGHVVLRGGQEGKEYKPNYGRSFLEETKSLLTEACLTPAFVVDCSHANSKKDHTLQPVVWDEVLQAFLSGDSGVVGMMLESNLRSGAQPLPDDLTGFRRNDLQRGVSVTDKCIDWATTEQLVKNAHEQIKIARG